MAEDNAHIKSFCFNKDFLQVQPSSALSTIRLSASSARTRRQALAQLTPRARHKIPRLLLVKKDRYKASP
jgi:hypothetical protein